MNQESNREEPPTKRFKADLTNGQLNDLNSEIRTASPLNGISFIGNFPNSKVLPVSQNISIGSNTGMVSNSKTMPVQSLLPGVVIQPTASQIQQQAGNTVGFVRIQNPVGAMRNVATMQRPVSMVPNANQIHKASTVVALNSNASVPLRIPLQGHPLRNNVAVIQQVGSSASSTPVNSIVLQPSALLQQQQQGRSFLVFQQQPVATGKQNTGSGQAVTALVIPQAAGSVRSQQAINVSQSLQQHIQNQLLLQKAQARQQLVSQSQDIAQQPSQSTAQQVQSSSTPNTSQQPSTSDRASPQGTGPSRLGPWGSDPMKRKQMCTQLFLLLHARSCKNHQNGGTCSVPVCLQMQNILRHISSCKLGRSCRENCCHSSIQLLQHWKTCNDASCFICQPIRAKQNRTNNPTNNSQTQPQSTSNGSTNINPYEVLGLAPNRQMPIGQAVVRNAPQTGSAPQSLASSQPSPPVVSASTDESGRDWHALVTEDLRMQLVHKLVQAVFPLSTTDALRDRRLSDLVENARRMENELFREANSREHYYHLLAEKIFKIHKDIEEKRKGNSAVVPSAQQQLQNILNTKKEELNSTEQCGSSSDTIQVPPPAGASYLTQEVKVENEVKQEPTDFTNSAEDSKDDVKKKIPFNKKVWGCSELRRSLMPVLEKLYRLDPESLPFRQPVDPKQLNIPDYFTVIKKPMDLSTIKRKLDTGMYVDPWEFVDDVWLMFENAWLYNRKSSRVHKCCTKLAELFEPEIDVVMRSMGFCCGKKYVFYPQVLCCYGKPMCTISVNSSYYSYQNRYVYCEPCFNEIKGSEVEISDDPTQPSTIIQKDLFAKTKNSEMEPESYVECTHCGRRQHQICSMYHEQIWPGCFVCNYCDKHSGVKRKENKFTAKNLMQTKLSMYLENRINSFLRDNKSGAGAVTIRVHSIAEKVVEIKPGMKGRFCNPEASPACLMNEPLPYIAKAIFAYQEVDGCDVCFFGMHVQEYGSNCPAPNTRRVYIAYLDSVNFFQPKVFRTSVYHEILIGYLDYVKNLGFTSAHIWACPPSEGDDYIFHCHPSDMKIPKPKRLADWYKKMLDKAIIERVVIDYKDIIKDALENGMQNVTELPYFEGDFWPNVIETCIAELEQDEHRRKLEVAGDVEDSDSVQSSSLDCEDNCSMESSHSGMKKSYKGSQGSKKKSNSKKSAISKKSSSRVSQAYPGNDLMSKLFVMMEKHREVFFVVRLKTHHETQGNLPPIRDPDPMISSDMMDGRDNFLMICREKHYEFSSTRRAKHSSMVMLYELHTQAKDSFVYVCNYCRANIETHYHCLTCDDFDLCIPCYMNRGHVHSMEKIGLDLDDDDRASLMSANGSAVGKGESLTVQPLLSQQEAKKRSIQKCIQSLVHACYCRSNALPSSSAGDSTASVCQQASCMKMKQIMQHGKTCKIKSAGGCGICKQLVALCCYHARDCNDAQCQVPCCNTIRTKFQHQQKMQKHHQAQLMKRRMAAMQRGAGIETHSQSYGQAPPNPRSSTSNRTVRVPIPSTVAPRSAMLQTRPTFQGQTANVHQSSPLIQQVKVSTVTSGASSATEGMPDPMISVDQESLKKLLTMKSQQMQQQNCAVQANRNMQDQAQLITVLKNSSQVVQAYIKKQEQNHTSSQAGVNEDGNFLLELVPAASSTASNANPEFPSVASQPRQQQIILTCKPNTLAQRTNLSGPGALGAQNLLTNVSLLHLNKSNRHLMLSQTQPNPALGASQMQDSTLTLQDQLSRYADQL